MQKVGNCYYHFDRISIVSERGLKTIKKGFPINDFKKECSFFKMRETVERARVVDGYFIALEKKVRIEIVTPSGKALKLLRKHDSILFPYAITYLEITKDNFRESEEQAVSEVKEERGKLRKLWPNSYFIYEP